MMEGLELLHERNQPGLTALGELVTRLVSTQLQPARLVGVDKLLRSRVLRLRFDVDAAPRSIVAKRLSCDSAKREQAVLRRWLPAVGLEGMAQALLGEASDPLGRWVWHVYEDLGDSMLAHRPVSAGEIRAAVDVVAQLHLRFEGHPLIDECRAMCGGRGMEFFDRHVLRAIQQLELLSSRMSGLTDGCEDLLNGLVARRDGSADRARLMREFGGPATFLHGDLWTSNVCVVPSADGHRARLIDWDRAGVGPISYDLSALLRRFERGDRMQILDHYREAVGHANWPVPSNREMNALFDTAEHARIANEVAWLAVAAMQDDAGWAITELAGIAVFAGSLRPLLPD